MKNRLESVELGNHIIAVYQNKEEKLKETFDFLKQGLDKDEIVMLITDEMPKDKIRQRMRKEWKIDVESLESRDHVIIKDTNEWYFPYDVPNADRLKMHWLALAEIARVRGRHGIRVVGDMAAFFKRGFVEHLINYESALEPRFNIPMTGICAYDSKDVETLSAEQFYVLCKHHVVLWK